MSVAVRIGKGIVSNDLVEPPQPVLFQPIEITNHYLVNLKKSSEKNIENLPGPYYLKSAQIENSPLLNYKDKKFNFTTDGNNLVVLSLYPLPLQQIYESETIELEDKDGSLGTWFLYFGENFDELEKSEGLKFHPFWIILLFIIIVVTFILVRLKK